MTQLIEAKNLKELMSHLTDETVARQYMEQMRWNGDPFGLIAMSQNHIN